MKKATYSILLVVSIVGAFLAGSVVNQRAGVDAAAAAGRGTPRYACPMHPQYTSDRPGDCPACGMMLVARDADGVPGDTRGHADSLPPGVVKVSAGTQQLVGVRVSPVERTAGTHSLRMVGRVAAEETRTYTINAGSEGFVREVSAVTTGSRVSKGQLLATVAAPDAISAIQAFIVTLNAQDRLRQSGVDESAQANPNSSVFEQRLQKLQDMGMSDLQIEEIRRTRDVPRSIRILAPADGFVLTRNISAGQKFERGADWYRTADLSRVWILADAIGIDADDVRPGLHATITAPDRRRSFDARVSDVLPQFDAATRTLKVRLEVDNPGYVLRPDMFVDVDLPIALPAAMTVPIDAVLDSGLRKTVFVERGEGVFEPRQVRTGWRFGDRVEIVDGLTPGERIVTSGTFLIDSESRMKLASARIAAGSSRDPVCAMEVDERQARATGRTSEYGGRTYLFCSMGCKRDFDKEPAKYAVR